MNIAGAERVRGQGHLISNMDAPEGFPLEGKLSPKVTDEVSTAAKQRLSRQKINVSFLIENC